MKTATIPALRVEPELRLAVQNVLQKGETLSGFLEEALRANIDRRLHQQVFMAKGIASSDEAKLSQEYYAADTVMSELAEMYQHALKQTQLKRIVAYQVRFTKSAREDLKRLYRFLLEQDMHAANHALLAINKAVDLMSAFPFSCRKAQADNPLIRELIISFGSKGYVALFEIESDKWVTILALRHQREDDYY